MMEIRIAATGDAAALLDIYKEYIATPITFEYELPTLVDFSERIAATLKTYPYLVGMENGKIIGYAYAGKFASRPAYQWGAELSVYLHRNAAGRGLGTQLYLRLMELLKMQGIRTVYGCVTTPNSASERLHKKLGFERIALFQNAGFKNGAWHDVTWFGKTIAEYSAPSPLIPFSDLRSER